MLFRPLPVLTLLTLPILAVLIWLGGWQMQRAAWKTGLVRDFEAQAKAAPMSLEAALCGAGEPAGRIVSGAEVTRILPPADAARTVRMFGGDDRGQAGWRLLVAAPSPACAAGQGALIVSAGFEPIPGGGAPTAGAERYLVTAWPTKGPLEAANSPPENDWHWFDAPAMAQAMRVDRLNDRYYLAPFSGQLPDMLARVPPAQHYGYAVTWYGMAVALVVIYAAFHARAGRLRFAATSTRSDRA